MIGVLNLARWEWFKLRRRWMPWILLAILLAFSQLAAWSDLDNQTLTQSLHQVLSILQTFALIMLTVLAASVIGLEYGLGTLRPALARGTGRWQYLAGKFLLLATVTAATLLLILLVTMASNLVSLLLGGGPASGGEPQGWLDVLRKFGNAWFSLMPYLALVVLVTLVTRSTAAGNAIGISYFFAEQIVSLILSALFDWFPRVTDYLLVSNITDFTGGLSINFGEPQEISLLRPGLVLLVYTITLYGLAFWLFNRRDIGGASGS
jgi:ABC-2 type transport system permease protein